jgi:tetratricopeptide (TPR) repeat protein
MWLNFTNRFATRHAGIALAALLGTALSLPAQAFPREDFNSGLVALMKQDYNGSIKHFTDAINSNNLRRTNLAIAYQLRGVDYLGTRRNDEAIADFGRALAINPELATAYNDRAIAYRRNGDNSRAITDYSEAIRLMPNVGSFYLNRGVAHSKNSNWEEAIADYNQALAHKANRVSALVGLGDAHLQLAHSEEARTAYHTISTAA